MKRKVFSLLAMVVVLSLLAACAPKVVKETVIVETSKSRLPSRPPQRRLPRFWLGLSIQARVVREAGPTTLEAARPGASRCSPL